MSEKANENTLIQRQTVFVPVELGPWEHLILQSYTNHGWEIEFVLDRASGTHFYLKRLKNEQKS